MKLALKVILALILIVILVFVTLLYFKVTNRDCMDISEPQARVMIDNTLRSKSYNAASNGTILGYGFSDIEYSHELNREQEDDKNLGLVELQYNNKLSGQPIFTAVIYSNCEIQWVKNGT